MKNEHTGRLEINITHDCSTIENLKKGSRMGGGGEDVRVGAIVDSRDRKNTGRMCHEYR
jgi:hypothetical protein